MGCPILLGFAEKTKEVYKTWAAAMLTNDDYSPDMVRHAMSVRHPFKATLERRAKAALGLLVRDVLRQALERSQMRSDAAWLQEIPTDLEYEKTREILAKIKDRALAWKVNSDMLEVGKARTEGEFEMVFIKRVWQIASLADSLMYDMAQESYATAGTALAHAMAAAAADTGEWAKAFEILKETE